MLDPFYRILWATSLCCNEESTWIHSGTGNKSTTKFTTYDFFFILSCFVVTLLMDFTHCSQTVSAPIDVERRKLHFLICGTHQTVLSRRHQLDIISLYHSSSHCRLPLASHYLCGLRLVCLSSFRIHLYPIAVTLQHIPTPVSLIQKNLYLFLVHHKNNTKTLCTKTFASHDFAC